MRSYGYCGRPLAAAADGSVGRTDGMALLKAWYLSSAASQGGTLSISDFASSAHVAAPWEDDRAFLSWVEGASGAARIAMELKVGAVHLDYSGQ